MGVERNDGKPVLTVSVVSHGHGPQVSGLLADLGHCDSTRMEVVLTFNVSEPNEPDLGQLPFPVRVIRNSVPSGFGANHNAAFEQAQGEYFCVINPDIRLPSDPFALLLAALADGGVGVAGPLVLSPDGEVEDSARRFPTVGSLVAKFLRRIVLRRGAEPEYVIGDDLVTPDWIGGMCMVFRSSTFEEIGGFDERYFLYYEDVDLCWRLRQAGLRVALVPNATVVHGAQRASWRSLRHMRWHAASMARFLVTQARGSSTTE